MRPWHAGEPERPPDHARERLEEFIRRRAPQDDDPPPLPPPLVPPIPEPPSAPRKKGDAQQGNEWEQPATPDDDA